MENNKSKFNIGEKVFYLKDNLMKQEIILGIFSCFDGNLGYSNKKVKFVEFRYFFEMKVDPYQYGWVSEIKLFKTKEKLIESL